MFRVKAGTGFVIPTLVGARCSMKKLCILLFFMPLSLLRSQEKLGISNSNYSSSNSIFLNPSSSADSRTYMQLNLAGANVFAMSNLAYAPRFGVWGLMKASNAPALKPADNKMRKYIYALASLEGPAFVISKRNYGAGIFVRARSVANARNIPYYVAGLMMMQPPDMPGRYEFDLRNAGFSNMSWIEYGGNFAYMVHKQKDRLITVGGSIRYLSGLNLSYLNIRQLDGYYSDNSTQIESMKARIRYSEPAFRSGRGWGADFGVTYKKMLGNVDAYFAHSVQSSCNYIDYKYKIGISLRDAGYIRFRNSTSSAEVEGAGYYSREGRDYTDLPAQGFVVNTTYDYGPVTGSLPTSLSGQFDYNFENSIYLNVTAVKNLVPAAVTGVQAPDLISVCPRFEMKNLELAMPLTFQRFIYPQLGFAFRVRSFVLGFDNVLPFVIRKNTYGLNVYFNLGISLFRNQACNLKKFRTADCSREQRKAKRSRKKQAPRLFGRNKTYSK